MTSYICSKMDPDGFGGSAVCITADAIMGKSTHDILEDFLAEIDDAPLADRTHCLLGIREKDVRERIRQLNEANPDLSGPVANAITGNDVRDACIAVARDTALAEEQGVAELRAALAAIHEVEKRISSAS